MKNKYSSAIKGKFVRIYINNTLHVMFKTNDFIGIQSYLDDVLYSIEIYTKNTKILLEYDHIDKWKEVLKLIDQIE